MAQTDDDPQRILESTVGDASVWPAVVPKWVVPPDVQDFIAKNPEEAGLDGVIGPAIKHLRLAAFLCLGTQVLFYLGARSTSSCQQGEAVAYAKWLWLPVLPVAVYRGYAEWRGVRHAAYHYAMNGGTFTFLGSPYCAVWLVINLTSSLANLADFCTDGGFTATLKMTFTCDAGKDLEHLWLTQWDQSLPAQVGIPAPSLPVLANIFWIISIFQIALPILTSTREGDLGYGFPMGYDLGEDGAAYRAMTPSCCPRRQLLFHTGAALDLADAAGMVSLQKICFNLAWNKELMEYYRKEGAADPGDAVGQIAITFAPVAAGMVRKVCLSWIAENVFQLSIQITMLGLFTHLAKQSRGTSTWMALSSQGQTFLSIALGLTTTSMKMMEAYSFLKLGFQFESFIKEMGGIEAALAFPAWHTEINIARRSIKFVILGLAVMVLNLGFATAKFVAVFACESSLLNFTGCVAAD